MARHIPRTFPRAFSLLLLPALSGAFAAAPSTASPSVFVAYPPAEYRVAADHVILEGSVTPGASLMVSGQRVYVGADGLFMEWWPLKPGLNTLRLVASSSGQSGATQIRVTRTVQTVLPARPTAINRASLTPDSDVEFWDIAADTPAERHLEVVFRGSPGGRASVLLPGLPAQAMAEGPAGLYHTTLTVPGGAQKGAAVSVRLTGQDGKTVTALAPGHLSVSNGLARTGVQKSGTIVGLGLNDAVNSVTDLDGNPVLYPRDGMTFTLVGRQGSDVRARLAPGLSVLISASQLNQTPGAPAPAVSGPLVVSGSAAASPDVSHTAADSLTASPVTPAAADVPAMPASTPATSGFSPAPAPTAVPVPTPVVSTAPAVSGDWQLRVPLNGARIPFTIDQTGPGQLTLGLYGLSAAPQLPALDDFLKGVRRGTPGTGFGNGSGLVLDFNTTQLWGFTANYDGPDLVLTVRRPPTLEAARPLSGRVITLDPGHGGSQFGGAGSLHVPEKDIVLPIALRVAQLLQAQGATIRMTRTGDITLGLYDRDLMAEAAHSDLLVSIHANALPDGHDPRGIRGPELHFTHQQAQNVSAAILNQIHARLPEIGAGKGLMPGANLALTRPTTQISLLIETAYLTDAENLRVLMTADGRERFAQAIAGGIVDFYRAQASR